MPKIKPSDRDKAVDSLNKLIRKVARLDSSALRIDRQQIAAQSDAATAERWHTAAKQALAKGQRIPEPPPGCSVSFPVVPLPLVH
jgi:hypothetical protein